MKEKKKNLSEEQLDFLREMMNIGAGNAATAFTQMLQCEVDMRIPRVHVLPTTQVPSVLSDPSLPVACVRMRFVGDVVGDLFFIVPDEHKMTLIRLMEQTSGMRNAEFKINNQQSPEDLSVLEEIGNILAGVYFTAIHDFCKLNIYHSVPRIAIDMIQSLMDESLASLSRDVQEVIMVVNEFSTDEGNIRTFFLLIPSAKSVRTLVDSIKEAMGAMGRNGDK